jgi:hypothetical protein
MGRPKGSKTKKKSEEIETPIGKKAVLPQPGDTASFESNEPEYYDPNVEKGEPITYESEAKEEITQGVLKAGPGEKLFESPGGCIHVGPDDKFFIYCKEEGINIRPRREGSVRRD